MYTKTVFKEFKTTLEFLHNLFGSLGFTKFCILTLFIQNKIPEFDSEHMNCIIRSIMCSVLNVFLTIF